MFSISVQEENGLTDDCHLTIVPVRVPRVKTPLVLPVQMVVPPVTEPGAVVGLTVIVPEEEVAEVQVPLLTTTRYCVVAVKLVAVNVVVVLLTSTGVVQLSVEYCHLTTSPVLPARVNPVLLVPLQTVVPPRTMPPTLAGSTFTVLDSEFEAGHTPF